MAQAEGIAILPWSPLAGGLLTDKFDPDKPKPEGARRSTFDFPPVESLRARTVFDAVRKVARNLETSIARVSLAWLLTRPHVTTVIIGAKTVEQLSDNLSAAALKLAPEHVKELDAASALPQEYPGWMVDRQGSDRRPPA